jgi:alpha-ketoglutarate-dependent taurine dioxygenase
MIVDMADDADDGPSPRLAGDSPLARLPHLDFALLAGATRRSGTTAHAHWLDHRLGQCGALLLRGVPVAAPDDLERILATLIPAGEFLGYDEDRVSPRTRLGSHVYTSTEFRASLNIPLHNECSPRNAWPMRIIFHCRTPAARGGRTPIADIRRMTAALPRELVAEFAARGLRYLRNVGTRDVSLEFAFGTDDRDAISTYCARQDIAIEWRDGGRARMTFLRPALAAHPDTGEALWFNYVGTWTRRSWDRAHQLRLRATPDDELPYHTTFGDGGAIPDRTIDTILAAYAEATVAFDWRAGDLLILDNMRWAHGREPFTGPREVWTVMARLVQRTR